MTLSATEAEALLYREARLLDERQWDAWLELFTEDAVFWAPAWRDEASPTSDPNTELSLIYYEGRSNLADRVWRLRSGLSIASTPLARTAHAVTNVEVGETDRADEVTVHASWTVHLFNPRRKTQHAFFGRYEHRLRHEGAGWRIARKKILLLNDYIPTVVDFYCL